jgi:sugar lactone lactonase YvrE
MKNILFILSMMLSQMLVAQTTHWVSNVNNSGSGSLRDAVSNASSGDIIRFNPSLISGGSATINLTSKIIINDKSLRIIGLINGSDSLIISGGNTTQIFDVKSTNTSTDKYFVLDSIVAQNGLGGYGGLINTEFIDSVNINNSIFRNSNGDRGGAIAIRNISQYKSGVSTDLKVYISNSSLYNNSANNFGGAIFIQANAEYSSTEQFVHVENVSIYDNEAKKGAGIYSLIMPAYNAQGDLGMHVQNSTLVDNKASQEGGAIYSLAWCTSPSPAPTASLIIKNSTITGNEGSLNAGGIYARANTNSSTVPYSFQIEGSIIVNENNIYQPVNPKYISNGYNAFSNNEAGVTYQIGDHTNISEDSLQLGDLQLNGGSTPTVLPLAGSFIIDAGNPSDLSPSQNGAISGIRNIGAADGVQSPSCSPISIMQDITACDSYTSNGMTYTSDEVIYDTLSSILGCDSIVITMLEINRSNSFSDTIFTCSEFEYNGEVYVTDTLIENTLTNIKGCDSLFSLQLHFDTIKPMFSPLAPVVLEVSDMLCGVDTVLPPPIVSDNCGTPLVIGSQPPMYMVGAPFPLTWVATDEAGNMSTEIQMVLVLPKRFEDTVVVCDSYTWIDGNTYTTDTVVLGTFPSSLGCDSFVSLTLTVNNSTTGIDEHYSCPPFTWIDGNEYTTSNNSATHTLTNSVGCDSVVTLNLTIDDTIAPQLELTNDILTLYLDSSGSVDVDPTAFDLSTSDNCGEFTLVSSVASFDCDDVTTQEGCGDFSADFDGVSEYAISDNQLSLGNTYTFEAWVYVDLALIPNDWKGIITTNTTPSGGSGASFQMSLTADGRLIGEVIKIPNSFIGGVGYRGHQNITNGWHHLAVSIDNSNQPSQPEIKMYVDGNEQAKSVIYNHGSAVSGDFSLSRHLQFGVERDQLSNGYCDIIIDEVRVWNEVRSGQQIVDNMLNCFEGNENNLAAYYPIEQGSGSIIQDEVNSNNMSFINVANASNVWVDAAPAITGSNGLENVIITATDDFGNQSSETVSVNIVDNIDPLAICQNVMVTLDPNTGMGSISVNDIDNGSSDNCGIDTLYLNKYMFTCADLGDNPVALTVVDVNGNVSTCTANVEVVGGETYSQENITVCNTFTWFNGETITSSATLVDTIPNVHGCDSIVTAVVTVNHLSTSTDTINSCVAYEYDNQTYTSDAIIVDTLINSVGCDSILTRYVFVDDLAPIMTCSGDTTISSGISEEMLFVSERGGSFSVVSPTGDRTVVNGINGADGILFETDSTAIVSAFTAQGSIYRVNIRTGNVEHLINIQGVCQGMSLDGTGQLYVANEGGHKIVVVDLTTNTVVNSITGFNQPIDVVFENPTTILVSEYSADKIKRHNLITGVTETLVTGGVNGPTDLFVESPTSVLIAEHVNNRVSRLNLVTNQLTTLHNIPHGPHGIAKGADGNMYVSLYNNGNLMKIDPTGSISVFATGFTNPVFIGLNPTGGCYASLELTEPTVVEQCLDTLYNDAPDVFVTGETVVTWTAVDENGNTSTCTQTVTVEDTEAPVIGGLPEVIVVESQAGICGAVLNLPVPTVRDNCGEVLLSSTAPPIFPVGPTPVVWTAVDEAGNTSTLMQMVNVLPIRTEDTLTVCDSYTWANGETYTTDTVVLGNFPTINGCDSFVSLTLTVNYSSSSIDEHYSCPPFTWIDGNEYTESNDSATVTLTNAVGCDSIVTLNLTIEDTINPTLVVNENVVLYLDSNGNATLTEADYNNGSYDNCTLESLEVSQSAFTCGDVTTQEGCGEFALDLSNSNTYGRSQNPISFGNQFTIEAWVYSEINNSNFNFQGIVTTANNGGTGAIVQMSLSSTGKLVGEVFGTNPGTNGRLALESVNPISNGWHHVAISFNNPNPQAVPELKLYIDGAQEVTTFMFPADQDITGNVSGSRDIYIGAERGLNGSGYAKVTIDEVRIWNDVRTSQEILNNRLQCLNGNEDNLVAYYPIEDGSGTSIQEMVNGNTATLNGIAPGVNVWADAAPAIQSTLINHSVVVTATDGFGNTSFDTVNVEVVDNIDPLAICQSVMVTLDPSTGMGSISVNDIDNGSYDNCGIDTMYISNTTFSCADLGENTVVLTVVDVNGNISTCEANVDVVGGQTYGVDSYSFIGSSFTWIDGNVYTESNDSAIHIIPNHLGCDSVITLDLTLIPFVCDEDLEHCDQIAYFSALEYVNRVEVQDLDKTTGNNGGYINLRDVEADQIHAGPGELMTVDLTAGYWYWTFTSSFRIYIDYNQDGDFNDVGELVFQKRAKNSVNGSFNIKPDVTPGCYTMRVNMSWPWYTAGCGNYTFGETEDYLINIDKPATFDYYAKVASNPIEDEVPNDLAFEFAHGFSPVVFKGNKTQIVLRAKEAGITQFNVVDALGRTVETVEINHEEGVNELTIDTETLPVGVYHLTNNKALNSMKFIVQ